jgi:hypothetical protein
MGLKSWNDGYLEKRKILDLAEITNYRQKTYLVSGIRGTVFEKYRPSGPGVWTVRIP